jgi:hypothetical protein
MMIGHAEVAGALAAIVRDKVVERIDQDDIVRLIKHLIDIHRKWIVDGASDAEDKENEHAGLSEQQFAIDEFATRLGLPDGVSSKLNVAICQFLNGGVTGNADGPLVEEVTEDLYRMFANRLSEVIANGGQPREVFTPFQEVKAQIAGQIYIAMDRLGAGAELLSFFKGWGVTLGDSEILTRLHHYNSTCERGLSAT